MKSRKVTKIRAPILNSLRETILKEPFRILEQVCERLRDFRRSTEESVSQDSESISREIKNLNFFNDENPIEYSKLAERTIFFNI